jgi:hypothetical protein
MFRELGAIALLPRATALNALLLKSKRDSSLRSE